jgi:hypothetical protein
MKQFSKVLLLVLLLFGALVFAKQEQPPGEPPFGVAVQSDAKGTKLNGALFAEFYSCSDPDVNGHVSCNGRFVLRLRKGNTKDLETFYAQISGIDPSDPHAAQGVIADLMEPQIIDRFFGNNNDIFTDDPLLTVKVKSVTEFGAEAVAPTDLTTTSQFVLTDLQLAVN